jgi:hypothetical protein
MGPPSWSRLYLTVTTEVHFPRSKCARDHLSYVIYIDIIYIYYSYYVYSYSSFLTNVHIYIYISHTFTGIHGSSKGMETYINHHQTTVQINSSIFGDQHVFKPSQYPNSWLCLKPNGPVKSTGLCANCLSKFLLLGNVPSGKLT